MFSRNLSSQPPAIINLHVEFFVFYLNKWNEWMARGIFFFLSYLFNDMKQSSFRPPPSVVVNYFRSIEGYRIYGYFLFNFWIILKDFLQIYLVKSLFTTTRLAKYIHISSRKSRKNLQIFFIGLDLSTHSNLSGKWQQKRVLLPNIRRIGRGIGT